MNRLGKFDNIQKSNLEVFATKGSSTLKEIGVKLYDVKQVPIGRQPSTYFSFIMIFYFYF